MLKFNIKFFVCLLFIIFVNSTTIFANINSDLEKLERDYHNLGNEKTKLLKQQTELLKQQNGLLTKLTNNQNLTNELIANINNQLTNITNILTNIINRLNTIEKDMDKIRHDIEKLKNTPPTSIYFTGRDKVWHWHSSFDFITVTLGPRVRIHASPSIYASNAPYNPEWTEHEDEELSIFKIVPGPGSVRGFGLLQAYRHSNNGWINLDDAKYLWCIKPYGKEAIRYWHYENGVEIPEWPNAYCVKP